MSPFVQIAIPALLVVALFVTAVRELGVDTMWIRVAAYLALVVVAIVPMFEFGINKGSVVVIVLAVVFLVDDIIRRRAPTWFKCRK